MFPHPESPGAPPPSETAAGPAVDGGEAGPSVSWIAREKARIESRMAEAAAGDEAAAQDVAQFFEDPDGAWQQLGDLTELLKLTLANRLLGNQPVESASLRRRIEFQIEELVGEHPTPLEKLAAERLVLASQMAAAQEVAALNAGEFGKPSAIKMLEGAERRIQLAVKTLQAARAVGRRRVARRGGAGTDSIAAP